MSARGRSETTAWTGPIVMAGTARARLGTAPLTSGRADFTPVRGGLATGGGRGGDKWTPVIV